MMERKSGANAAALLRGSLVAIMVVAQFALMVLIAWHMEEYSVALYIGLNVASVVVVLFLLNRQGDSSYKIAWILIVSLIPVFGLLLFMMWGRGLSSSRDRRYREGALAAGREQTPDNPELLGELAERFPARRRASHYLQRHGFPLYKNTNTRYLPIGEEYFEALMRDMEAAQRFIFLEYFIVAHGIIWDRMLEIMQRKAAQGVEVRLLYDDAGCLFTLEKGFRRNLEALGIRVAVFAPVHRYVSELYLNYRNHQKVAVIDGHIAYAGGINLADEYANIYPKYGHWKDTALRMEGDAAWGHTVTFLSMWELTGRGSFKEDYTAYRPVHSVAADSFVQPFTDNPGNNPENPAEDLYRQLLSGAKRYCYITTPYVVIDEVMNDALRMAAQSGVDVRIITPKRPDHWYVHMVTRSYYGQLMRYGVRVYEYTPGFMHAKMLVTDDEAAIIGSINMDYRSFYLHYENAVYLVDDPSVTAIREDIEATLGLCEEITMDEWRKRPLYVQACEVFLKLFATLM